METLSVPIPATAPRAPARLLQLYEWIARRELLACAVVLALTLGIRALLLPSVPIPEPAIEDEFSYLLAADTYASGRLVNPPHPLWQHFETLHELMQPVYASKYPPLQGLVLAFGQKLFGQPWIGVYLSVGLMCFFVCWMLQGWLTPNAAFLGGLLFMLRCGILSYWMDSYWGGAVAAIGGCLVLGGLVRVWRRDQAAHLATAALGLAILMHSRPFEGAVLGAIVTIVLIGQWRRWPADLRRRSWRVVPAALLILLFSAGAVAYIDVRVTGHPLEMPHALYQKQYIIAPMFAFLPLAPEPEYRHADIRAVFAGWNLEDYKKTRSDLMDVTLDKLTYLYDFFFGLWPLLIPPLAWPYRLKTTEERLTVGILLAFIALANLPLIGYQPHYTAPVAGLLYVRFMQTLTRLYHWRPAGKPIGFAIAVFFVTLFGIQFEQSVKFFVHLKMPDWVYTERRAKILHQLEQQPGKQLVLVRYSPQHDAHEEWIYNRAGIDASKIVWAHRMGPQQDAPLLDYFRDRKVWVFDADVTPPHLEPYAEESSK